MLTGIPRRIISYFLSFLLFIMNFLNLNEFPEILSGKWIRKLIKWWIVHGPFGPKAQHGRLSPVAKAAQLAHAEGVAWARPSAVNATGTFAVACAPAARRCPVCRVVFTGGTSGLQGTRRARCWGRALTRTASERWGSDGVPRRRRVSKGGGGSYSFGGRRRGWGAVQPRKRMWRGRSSLKGVVGGGALRDSDMTTTLRRLCLDRRQWEDLGVTGGTIRRGRRGVGKWGTGSDLLPFKGMLRQGWKGGGRGLAQLNATWRERKSGRPPASNRDGRRSAPARECRTWVAHPFKTRDGEPLTGGAPAIVPTWFKLIQRFQTNLNRLWTCSNLVRLKKDLPDLKKIEIKYRWKWFEIRNKFPYCNFFIFKYILNEKSEKL
jgi:hypothetical protein